MWIDEVSVYKNLITDKEIAKPELPEIGEGGDSGDGDNPGNENIYVWELPIVLQVGGVSFHLL